MTKRILAVALAFAATGAFAQSNVLSLGNLSTGVTQNFDALGTATVTTNGITGLPTGVFLSGATTAPTSAVISNGGSNAGGFYNFGTTNSDTDRALGSQGSSNATAGGGAASLYTGLRIRNTTNAAISSFFFEYVLEQYRASTGNSTAAIPEGYTMSYRLVNATEDDATFQTNLRDNTLWSQDKFSTTYFDGPNGFAAGVTPVNGVQTGAAGGFIPAPQIGATTQVAIDGNAAANQRKVESFILLGQSSDTLAPQALLPGQDIAIRFLDRDSTGADGGIAIDNFRAVPEPATMAAMALGLGALAARRKRKSA